MKSLIEIITNYNEEIRLFTVFSFAVICAYIVRILVKYGAQLSISASQYMLQKGCRWMFKTAMYLSGLAVLLTGIVFSSFSYIGGLFMSVSGVLIFCVGVFAKYKKSEFMSVAHSFCAIVGFGLLALSFIFFFWPISFIIAFAGAFTYEYVAKHDHLHVTLNVEYTLIFLSFFGIMTVYYIIY